MSSEQTEPVCGGCGEPTTPWATSCPRCEFPIDIPLTDVGAPQLAAPNSWIDIAISNDEPAKVALLRSFLAENRFEFEESRRFVSVPVNDAERLLDEVELWAFTRDLPDDDRHFDSLASTLRDIGIAVITAVRSAIGAESIAYAASNAEDTSRAEQDDRRHGVTRIDLR